MSKKKKEDFDFQLGMENLLLAAGLVLDPMPKLGIVGESRLVLADDEFSHTSVQWLSQEGDENLIALMERSYEIVYLHFQEFIRQGKLDLSDTAGKEKIASLLDTVQESARKLDVYLDFWCSPNRRTSLVAQGKFFQLLCQFYRNIFAENQVDSQQNDEDIHAQGEGIANRLKDLETLYQDREYELFYLHNEDGQPYYDKEFFRHVQLKFNLNQELLEEDLLLEVRTLQDRDIQASANQILGDCNVLIHDFFKMTKKLDDNQFAKTLRMSVLALLLAADPHSLAQNIVHKSCLQYFRDFHHFLRQAFHTDEYQKWIAYSLDSKEQISGLLLSLIHLLSKSFFYRVGGIKQESIGLIHRMMRKGDDVLKSKHKPLLKGTSFWNEASLKDESLREYFSQFPSGPFFKILDVIHQDSNELSAFDPIRDANLPVSLYQLEYGEKKIEVLRIPSPTKQSTLYKAQVIEEFLGCVRYLGSQKEPHKHLIIHLQDRDSWQESARSRQIEFLQKNAEFHSHLFILGLPKDTSFYHQSGVYLHQNDAVLFLQDFQKLLKDPLKNGFCLPHSFTLEQFDAFGQKAMRCIHKVFFQNASQLSRQNREDWIEIFYQLLILKSIDFIQPDSISFICKDGVDKSPGASSLLYGFIKLLSKQEWGKIEQDYFLWLLYTPALLIRERAVQADRANRVFAVLEELDKEANRKINILSKLEKELPFSQSLTTLKVYSR